MQQKWKKSLLGSVLAAALGVGVAVVASPLAANAATVCCYRYQGVSNAAITANTYRSSPTVSLMDWGSVWVESTSGILTAHSRVYWGGTSTLGSGGGGGWVYSNPAGEVSNAYARCHFTWDVPDPGYTQNTYCDIKYTY